MSDVVLGLAEWFANEAHEGQKDTVTGEPYINHVQRVAEMVEGDDAKAVAWLHDVLEDSAFTSRHLLAEGIPARIVVAVELLTRRPPYDYASYIESIKRSGDPLALAVKLADLRDHLQPNCPARLRPRYEKALARLEEPVPAGAVARTDGSTHD